MRVIYILLSILTISSFSVLAENEKNNSENVELELDFKKYCYYENLKYSEGSRLILSGKLQICQRQKDGMLVWLDKA